MEIETVGSCHTWWIQRQKIGDQRINVDRPRKGCRRPTDPLIHHNHSFFGKLNIRKMSLNKQGHIFFFFFFFCNYLLQCKARFAKTSVHAADQESIFLRCMLGFHCHYARRVSIVFEERQSDCHPEVRTYHLLINVGQLRVSTSQYINDCISLSSFSACHQVNNSWLIAAACTAIMAVVGASTHWLGTTSSISVLHAIF